MEEKKENNVNWDGRVGGRCRSALDQSRPNSRSKDRVRMRTWTPLSRARRVLRARLVPCVLTPFNSLS